VALRDVRARVARFHLQPRSPELGLSALRTHATQQRSGLT
jgi:hypothetical protein